MNDDSAPDHSLPLFLSSGAEETEQFGSFRILRTGLLALTAVTVGGATLLLGGPGPHITAMTASFVDASPPVPAPVPAPAPIDDAPASPVQPVIEAQAAPPAPSDQQPAAIAPEPAEPKQADTGVDRDALFRQFQAWAQQHDSKPQQQESAQQTEAQTRGEPSAPPAPPQQATETTRSAPVRVVPKAAPAAAQAPARAAQKQRPARELRNARAEVESERRAKAAAAQTYWAPSEETRAPDTAAQNTDTPWLLRLFGGHN